MSLYWISLVLTLLVELSVIAVWLSFDHEQHDALAILMLVAGINFVTHPLAWLVFGGLSVDFWIIEIAVIVSEAIGLRWIPKVSFRKAFLVSAAMNLTSLTSGLWLAAWLTGK